MKRLLIEIGVGVGLLILVQLAEAAVTLPFPPATDAVGQARWDALLLEFALTAPCALLIAWVLAYLRLPAGAMDALLRGLVWLGVFVVAMAAIAVANANQMIFTVPTLYLLMAAIPAGAALGGASRARRHAGTPTALGRRRPVRAR